MKDSWSFTRYFSSTLGSLMKCGQLKSISLTLVDVLQNWLNWFHFLFLTRGLLVILIDFMIFSVTIHRCYNVYVNSYFHQALRLGNSLPIERTYDLNDFEV